MFNELKAKMRDLSRTRLVHRATWHLDARTLRDIGIEPSPAPYCLVFGKALPLSSAPR